MAWQQSDLDNILAAIASGALTVKFADQEITYRSMNDLFKAKNVIEDALNAPAGAVYARQHRAIPSNGF